MTAEFSSPALMPSNDPTITASRSWRRGRVARSAAASTLALALAFAMAPATGAWADEPTATPTESPSTETPVEPTPTAPATPEVSTTETPAPDAPADEIPAGDEPVVPLDLPDPDPTLPDLALDVRIKSDGTESWDADSAAGNDSGPNNGIVRVNDTVTYEVEYAVPSGNADNVTFTLRFPKGMEITELPGFCQATGSSITPATAGTPTIPLTATSIDELSEQTLVCNRGTIVSGTDIVDVTVKVLNLAHQGMALPVLQAQIIADNFNGAVAPTLPSVNASARLMWDISKNNVALEPNTGYAASNINRACPFDTARVCKMTYYFPLVSAPNGGKGAMPAVGDLTFVDDLSPEAMYPSLTSAQHAAMNADLDTYGSRAYVVPGSITATTPGFGASVVPGGTVENSVRDSGDFVAAQPGGAGTPVTLTISDADWSLMTFPSKSLGGSALPSNAAYAFSGTIAVYTPIDTIWDFGVGTPESKTLPTYNAFTELNVNGFTSSDVENSAQQPGVYLTPPLNAPGPINWNDYRTTSPAVNFGSGFGKLFSGVPGEPNNTSASFFSSGPYVGPPGGTTMTSGQITVAPTQPIISNLQAKGSSSDIPMEVSTVLCDVWDNTKLHLRAANIPGTASAQFQRIGSAGEAVWVSGYNNAPATSSNPYTTTLAVSKNQVPELTVEYGTGPAGNGASSDCSSGAWYSDPTDPAFVNDTVLAAQGVYTGVSRVRVSFVIPEPVAVGMVTSEQKALVNVAVSMQVADSGYPTGEYLPNWISGKMVADQNYSMDEILADPKPMGLSIYDHETHAGVPWGDRLILAHAQVRVDKQVRKGDTGSFSSTPPQTTGGDLVQYQLSPSLTSGAQAPGILKDVWVEDCLPGTQIYSSATVTPVLVQGTTPADAKRPACAAGETYIRWVLPDHEVNTVIAPIILSVTVDPTAEDGVYTNTVVVWAEDDASTLAQRSDQAQIQISNVRGVRITKQPLTPVVQVNRAGQTTNELNEWSVRFSNRLPGNAPVPTDPDIIDVLPKQGVLGSSFHGTFTFDSASVTEGDLPGQTVRILYTRAANPSEIPTAPSNGAAGATVWCDAPAGGAVVSGNAAGACPASAAEVTALRVQRSGPFSTGSAIAFTIRMVGIDNRGGDVYVNRATGHATGLENTVQSAPSPEVAIESSVGDYTWWDFNRNGIQDVWKDAPEQVASGVPVRIAGTDDLGNPVAINTTTGADGRYLFEQLRTSNAAGYTVTFTAPSGAEFTLKMAGTDPALDSNADPVTGAADPLVLGRDTHDRTIDAGLTPLGTVQVNKVISGAGGEFATGDELEFEVVCTFDDGSDAEPIEVLNQIVTFAVDGQSALTSDELGPLPAFSDCTVTETASGSADETPDPVSVVVPWDATAQLAGNVTASLTNFYSAGSLEVTKTLDGDAAAMKAAEDKVFEIEVTCQVEEATEGDDQVLTTLYSGVVKIRGGQTKYLVNEADEPRALPLGATCFGVEINTGGAAKSVVDHDTFDKGVVVTDGDSENLQVLSITAVNTFKDDPKKPLATTGNNGLMLAGGASLAALGLLVAGALLILRQRRKQEH